VERGREGTGRRKGRGGERGGNGRGGKARGALGVDLPYLLGGGGEVDATVRESRLLALSSLIIYDPLTNCCSQYSEWR